MNNPNLLGKKLESATKRWYECNSNAILKFERFWGLESILKMTKKRPWLRLHGGILELKTNS